MLNCSMERGKQESGAYMYYLNIYIILTNVLQ